MKKFYLLAACALFSASMAFAQNNAMPSTEWQGVRASYGFGTASLDTKDESIKLSETGSASEFSVAYSKGISLSANSPVFLEVAPEFSYLSCSDKKLTGSTKNTFTNMGISVPLNLGYMIKTGESMVLAPYVGMKAKLNVVTKESIKVSNESAELDYFKDDLGGKRFQLGAQVGCGAYFNNFYVGLSYHMDLMPVIKMDSMADDADQEMNLSSLRLTVGFNF